MQASMIVELLKGLNPPQRQAVTHSYDRNTLVLAGAGSGKTRVLTKRIAFIIAHGHSTSSILAVTFTNKAADEMRKRLSEYIGKENAKKILMGTFHSVCVELLRQFGKEIGVPKYFTIYDSGDAKQLMKEVMMDITGAYDKELVSSALGKISNMKNSLISPQEASLRCYENEDRLIAMAYERYQQKLAKNKALDFDDLIMKTVLLLRSSNKAKSYCNNRFKFVMSDEVQDTNKAQYELLELIAGSNNIFLVGDDSQSIYGWRGADINNILTFQDKYPNCRIIKLEQNYRSTQTIVNAGNALIKHNTKKLEKTCFSASEVGEPIKIIRTNNDIKESEFIVGEIVNLVKYCGYKFSDFAILYRTNRLSRGIEDKLMAYGIPYQVVAGLSFYNRKEIKDTVSIMQSVANPSNDMAFKRVLGVMPGIGDKSIQALQEIADKDNSSLYDSISKFDGRSKAPLQNIAKMIGRMQKYMNKPVSEFLKLVLETTGYVQRLSAVNTKENQDRIENIEELVNVACQFEQNNQTDTLTSFLDRVSLSSDTDATKDEDKVKLMTVHASKGLEFPCVFIMAVEENILPHKNCQSNTEIEEERRLLYVAVTRAEKLLYISHASTRMTYGKINTAMQSRFISEIPMNLKMEIW